MDNIAMPTELKPFANRMLMAETSAVREILKVTEMPDIISFAGGLPAPELFPVEEVAQSFYKVISEDGAAALQYSTTEGFPPLREYIAAKMRRKGMHVDANNILITSGSQQGLDLAAKALINVGDKVIVERPTYLAAIQSFSLFEAQFITVASDDQGMDIEDLERQLSVHNDVKFIYLVANFQNPSGTTLSLERRKRLIELATEYGVRILEDDPYGELRYRGEHLPTLKSLDTENLVVYLSTFSKTMTPGLRLGWMVADAQLYAKLVIAKQATDLHTNTTAQRAAHYYLTHYSPDAHVEKIRQVYGERCQNMLDALAKHFPSSVRWTKPEGGMFLWVELPQRLDATKLLAEALKEKVAFVPGSPFFASEKLTNFMRLNFSNQKPERIEEGIARLARVIKNA